MVILLIFMLALQDEKPKPRIYVSDSHSWELSGGFTATRERAEGGFSGGARPQTAEIIKTFGKKCPGVTVTMKSENAQYIVLMEHEGGKRYFEKDNKFAIFNKDGDAVKSGSTLSIGSAVKSACEAITTDWGEKKE